MRFFGFLRARLATVPAETFLARLKHSTHHTSSFVVVQVYFLTQCASSFAGVDEFPRQLVAKYDVIGAATPFLFGAHDVQKKNARRDEKQKIWEHETRERSGN